MELTLKGFGDHSNGGGDSKEGKNIISAAGYPKILLPKMKTRAA